MPARNDGWTDCIFCPAPAGSAEHTVLAALGGLRTDRTILCGRCNHGFSGLDAHLANDMRPLNAMIGVRNGRTKESLETEVVDPTTGRTYAFSDGRGVRHPDPLVLGDTTVDGVRRIQAVTSTQLQADEFLRQLKSEGKPIRLDSRETVPVFFTAPLHLQWNFGGPDTLRAVARIALNVLAHHYPVRARESWLDPFKRFIVNGGDVDEFVWYAFEDQIDPRLPPESFAFQHRFVLGFDHTSGIAYARVALLGVIDLAVRFGAGSFSESETLVHDVDILAASSPRDLAVCRISGAALMIPAVRTDDPSPYVQDRVARLRQRHHEHLWSIDAPSLIAALNATRSTCGVDRYRQIVEALEGQEQRLLNIATFVANDLKEPLAQLGDGGGSVAKAFQELIEGDASSRTGLTDVGRAHLDMLRYVLADHLDEVLSTRDVTAHELRLLLEGGPGAALVGRYMMLQVQNAHPLFRDDHATRRFA